MPACLQKIQEAVFSGLARQSFVVDKYIYAGLQEPGQASGEFSCTLIGVATYQNAETRLGQTVSVSCKLPCIPRGGIG